MTELYRSKLFNALRGEIQSDALTNRLMEEVAVEDLRAIEPIIDDIEKQAENRGKLSVLLEQAEELEKCDDCGHALKLHGPERCQHEFGDTWVDGESIGAWVAQGPCGCSSFTIEDI